MRRVCAKIAPVDATSVARLAVTGQALHEVLRERETLLKAHEVFLADARHERYVGDLSQRERASRIAVAEGRLGTNREYLENLLDSLHALGIDDPDMTELLRMVREAAGEAPVA